MGSHIRNTGPMLTSKRCGAKTRSGKPCRARRSPEDSVAECTAEQLDQVLHSKIPMHGSMASIRLKQ